MGMLLLGLSFLYGVAMAAALAVLFTMIAALTLLPALLTIVGRRVDRLRIPGLGKRAPVDRRRHAAGSAGAVRSSAGRCSRRCSPAGCCCSSASPRSRCGSAPTTPAPTRPGQDDARGLRPARRRLRPRASTARSRWSRRCPSKGDDESLVICAATLGTRNRASPTVTAIDAQPRRDTGVFQVYPTTSPQSEDTTELLDHIRGDVIPPIEAKTGAQLHVGGITAIFEDFGDAISEKLPLFIGVVVLLSALLLMTVFRSVLVPLKAIVMNLLSIGAAFGLIVAVFQWGWGASLIGVDGTGPIISFFPIFLFAIVFGLSMDYEVFLMSRIHEEWERRQRRDPRRHPRPGPDRPRDHRGGGDHDHRLRLLHDRRRPDHQTVRPRPRRRDLHRRGDHPLGPRPGGDAALRQARLVAARTGSTGSCRDCTSSRPRATPPRPASTRSSSETETRPGGLDDLVGLEAAGADVGPQLAAVLDDPDLLQVRVEAALGGDHRVAPGLAERRSLAAAVAYLGHRDRGW